MKKIEFTQDYSTRSKGDVREYRDSLAEHFVRIGGAKMYVPKRTTKEEKATKKDK